MKALGNWLTRTNTTQTALASKVGVSQPTISQLINGVCSASSDLLKRLSLETGLSIDELLADDMPSVAKHRAGSGFHGCTRGE